MPDSDSEPTGSLRLEGRVLGPDGRGVADADVWIDSIPRRTTKAGADGAFTFDNLIGRTYELGARSGDLVSVALLLRLSAESAPVAIRLRKGAHVHVTVVDSTETPIANASVRVAGDDVTATTDAKGEARLTASPGLIDVEANAAEYAPRRVTTAGGAFGAPRRTTIVLHKGFLVSGRVVDEQGKGVASTRIYALARAAALGTHDAKVAALTEQDGTFSISAVVGMHSFVFVDGEHAPTTTTTFDVDRAITGLEIVMKQGGVYAGSVVDDRGKPVPNARVHCVIFDMIMPFASRESGPCASWPATTDANGAFEIRGLPRTMVSAYAESDTAVSNEVQLDLTEERAQRDQTLVLELVAKPDSVIAGVVVDDTDAPVPGVVVNATLYRRTTAIASSATTDARGHFSISGLPDGQYALWPGSFDRPPMPPETAEAMKQAGLAKSWVLTMAKSGDKAVRIVQSRTGAVKGKVVFADNGTPVRSFDVDLEPTYIENSTTPGEEGNFELTDLQPTTFTLRVSGSGFVETKKTDVRVEAGKTSDVGTVAVQRGRTIAGKVVDQAGRPVPGASVLFGHGGVYGGLGRFDQPFFDVLTTVTDQSGHFSLGGFPSKTQLGPSKLIAGATHPVHGRSLPVEIPEGANNPAPITLELRDCGSVVGMVTQNGVPIRGAIIGAGSPEVGMGDTSEDGAFEISCLPAGTFEFRTFLPSEIGRSHKTSVRVDGGKQSKLAIEIPIGTIELHVIVKAKPGHEVSGARLFLMSGTAAYENYAQVTSRFFADYQGSATWDGDASKPASFDRIVPGEYSVCTMPLAFSPNDEKLMERVHGSREAVKVYCTPVRIQPTPAEQTLTVEVPSMDALL